MSFGNPMDYFNAGRVGGQANSNAVGMAIEGIVAKGESLNLVQQQALAQGMASIPGKALDARLDNQSVSNYYYNPLTGEKTSIGETTKGDKIHIGPVTDAALEAWEAKQWENDPRNPLSPNYKPGGTGEDDTGISDPSADPDPNQSTLNPANQAPDFSDIINSDAGQALIRQILEKKTRGGGL